MQFVRFIACVIAVPVIAIALVFACWIVVALPSRAEILVINDSNKTLSELTVHGSCKERRGSARPLIGVEYNSLVPRTDSDLIHGQ